MSTLLTKDTEIRFRTSKNVKLKAQKVYSHWGLNLGDAINAFLVKSIDAGGLPFEMREEMPNTDTIKAIEEAQQLKKDKNKKSYATFSDALKDIEFNEI